MHGFRERQEAAEPAWSCGFDVRSRLLSSRVNTVCGDLQAGGHQFAAGTTHRRVRDGNGVATFSDEPRRV